MHGEELVNALVIRVLEEASEINPGDLFTITMDIEPGITERHREEEYLDLVDKVQSRLYDITEEHRVRAGY